MIANISLRNSIGTAVVSCVPINNKLVHLTLCSEQVKEEARCRCHFLLSLHARLPDACANYRQRIGFPAGFE